MFQTASFGETRSSTTTLNAMTTPTYSSSPLVRRRLRINVCGLCFEMSVSLLDRQPSTLLGDRHQRLLFYDASRDELFLDRHRPTFEAVFAYYQTNGRLRRPDNVPSDVFYNELQFYKLDPGSNFTLFCCMQSDTDSKTVRCVVRLWVNPQFSRIVNN